MVQNIPEIFRQNVVLALTELNDALREELQKTPKGERTTLTVSEEFTEKRRETMQRIHRTGREQDLKTEQIEALIIEVSKGLPPV